MNERENTPIEVIHCVYCEDLLNGMQTNSYSILNPIHFISSVDFPCTDSFRITAVYKGLVVETEYKLTWEFLDPDGHVIKRNDSPTTIPPIPAEATFPIGWGITGIDDVTFEKPGVYTTRFFIDDQWIHDAPIDIVEKRNEAV